MRIPAVKERSTLAYLIKWILYISYNWERSKVHLKFFSPPSVPCLPVSTHSFTLTSTLYSIAAHDCSWCPKHSMHSDAVMPLHILFILLGIPFYLLMPYRIPSHPSNSKPNGFFYEDSTVSMDNKRGYEESCHTLLLKVSSYAQLHIKIGCIIWWLFTYFFLFLYLINS